MTTLEELVARVSELERRLSASEAVLALHRLKAHYGQLVDQRFAFGAVVDPATLATVATAIAELFSADGVWDGGPGLGRAAGRDAIAARLGDPTLTFSRHFFVNPRLEVTGPRATGRWEVLCPCRRPDGTSYWMCGYEDDVYERIDDRWLYRSMTLTSVFMAPVNDGWTRILV